MYVILNNLKKPQKLKYRGFAWKTEEKPFMAFETDEYETVLKTTEKWIQEERDFNITFRSEK